MRLFIISIILGLGVSSFGANGLEELIKLADKDKASHAGSAYEEKASMGIGQKLAEAMSLCSPKGSSAKGFDLIFIISKNGSVNSIEHTKGSITGACLKRMLSKLLFPPPPSEVFRLHIDMTISE